MAKSGRKPDPRITPKPRASHVDDAMVAARVLLTQAVTLERAAARNGEAGNARRAERQSDKAKALRRVALRLCGRGATRRPLPEVRVASPREGAEPTRAEKTAARMAQAEAEAVMRELGMDVDLRAVSAALRGFGEKP